MKVRVYYNLHKKCLSVQSMTPKGWRVWKHMKSIDLKNCEFKVSRAGRERVIAEGRKNVHAYIIGDLIEGEETKGYEFGNMVTYNPYKYTSFVEKATELPIHKANRLHINGRIIHVMKPSPKPVKHSTLISFAKSALEATKAGQVVAMPPEIMNASKHWQSCFANFILWQRSLVTADEAGIAVGVKGKAFAANGNKKLPFLSWSSMPLLDCGGAGECKKYCYSLKGWRNVHPYFRQLRNSLLQRFRFDLIIDELDRVLRTRQFKLQEQVDFRLFVDGDFDSVETVKNWMWLLRNRPQLRAYGYSKSWMELASFTGKWPTNYRLNLSNGSRFHESSGIARRVMALPITRGWFKAIGSKGGVEYNTPEYRAKARAQAKEVGLERVFVCSGLCGECTPKGHFCGSDNKADVAILTH